MEILEIIKEKGKAIEEEIDKLIPEGIEPEEFSKASRHLFKAGGKRLRPVLTLCAAEAVGGDSRRVVKSASAFEILHTFTLIHDDIMDKDHLRRGAKTVHEHWDEPMAIIAGDALFAKVFEALNENAKEGSLSFDEITNLFGKVSNASFRICQGQALDIEFGRRRKVTELEYLDMVEKKTGSLFEVSTEVGALLGGGSEEEVNALAEYGRLIGIAFQIRDDLLGSIGEEEKAGKPIGSDIREGKWTYLTVHAYENASSEDQRILLENLRKGDGSEEELQKVMDIFERTGAIDSAVEKSQELADKAKSELEILPKSDSKDFLIELADFSVSREL